MAATMQDVAREARVSRTAVSLVLNGRPGIRIRPETAERIREAARRLNYQPDLLARRLRARRDGRSRTFCLGFSANIPVEPANAPYYTEILNGVQIEMRRHGYHLILGSAFESAKEQLGHLQRLSQGAVDGWVLASRVGDEVLDWLREAALPAVVVGGDTVTAALDCVYADNLDAGLQATRHLLSLGHRRLAYVGRDATAISDKARLLGYRQALAEAGAEHSEGSAFWVGMDGPPLAGWVQRVMAGPKYPSGIAAISSDTLARPTALVAFDDRHALALLRAVRPQGFDVPKDLSIVGFDDIPMAALWDPPLTTVRMPMREMGAAAFRRLLERIERPDLPATKMVLPVEMVVRGSTAPPPD